MRKLAFIISFGFISTYGFSQTINQADSLLSNKKITVSMSYKDWNQLYVSWQIAFSKLTTDSTSFGVVKTMLMGNVVMDSVVKIIVKQLPKQEAKTGK